MRTFVAAGREPTLACPFQVALLAGVRTTQLWRSRSTEATDGQRGEFIVNGISGTVLIVSANRAVRSKSFPLITTMRMHGLRVGSLARSVAVFIVLLQSP